VPLEANALPVIQMAADPIDLEIRIEGVQINHCWVLSLRLTQETGDAGVTESKLVKQGRREDMGVIRNEVCDLPSIADRSGARNIHVREANSAKGVGRTRVVSKQRDSQPLLF